MKKIILLVCLLSTSVFAGDFDVVCKTWDENQKTFSLSMEVEKASGNYIDAWVNLKVFEDGVQIHSTNSTWSHGYLFFQYYRGQKIYMIELVPTGGQDVYKYDFLNIAANHPIPSGNSYLIYKEKEYQAECSVL